MSGRNTLTLRPVTAVNPAKLKRANELGLRFIDRDRRYILQAKTVIFVNEQQENTWVDIPLVPETYAT